MNMNEHKSFSSNHLDLQDGLLEKKKKKCRGNRKAQHLRRRMRRHQQKIDHNTIIQDENNNINDEQEFNQNYLLNKRKRQSRNRHDVHMSQST
ncbi:unnamed protein product [Adineta steineri]|uniref:Uncharacterized protein n=1 Tax=Adineta steineri TaxID=433720 RepID=A0A819FEV9_9BILA|nr:unnamed protein product [Adineta steineri]